MARIRTIKPEFWTSEDIAALPIAARLVFIGLWSYVDDNGVGIYNERLIASTLFPMDDPRESLANVRDSLAKLRDRGLIELYEAHGRRLIHICKWDEHQKVDRPRKPKHPKPSECDHTLLTCENTASREDASEAREDASEIPRSTKGSRDQGTKGSLSSSELASRRSDVDQLCNRLYSKIIENGSKTSITDRWRTEARLLIDRDGRDLNEALNLIDWCQQDQFWRSNILGMPKFRQQYDQLRLKSEQPRASNNNGHQPFRNPTDPSVYYEDLL